MGGNLMLLHAGPDEVGNSCMAPIADGGVDAHCLQFVLVFDRAGFYHRRCAVDPVNFRLLEGVDHVDVDEVNPERSFLYVVFPHLLHNRSREFFHLLAGCASHGSLDPRVGVAHVIARYPRAVVIDLYADVALLEKDGFGSLTKESVAKSGLQPAPAGSDGAADVADVFIVHREQRAQAIALHRLPGAIQPIVPESLPVDALLPVGAHQTETRRATVYHGSPPFDFSGALFADIDS